MSAFIHSKPKAPPASSQFIFDQYLFNSCGIKFRFKFIKARVGRRNSERTTHYDDVDEAQNQPTKTLGFNLIKPSHLGKLSCFLWWSSSLFLRSLSCSRLRPRSAPSLVSRLPSKIISVLNISFRFIPLQFSCFNIAFRMGRKGPERSEICFFV